MIRIGTLRWLLPAPHFGLDFSSRSHGSTNMTSPFFLPPRNKHSEKVHFRDIVSISFKFPHLILSFRRLFSAFTSPNAVRGGRVQFSHGLPPPPLNYETALSRSGDWFRHTKGIKSLRGVQSLLPDKIAMDKSDEMPLRSISY